VTATDNNDGKITFTHGSWTGLFHVKHLTCRYRTAQKLRRAPLLYQHGR
jgi:hypothetical protein